MDFKFLTGMIPSLINSFITDDNLKKFKAGLLNWIRNKQAELGPNSHYRVLLLPNADCTDVICTVYSYDNAKDGKNTDKVLEVPLSQINAETIKTIFKNIQSNDKVKP